MDEVCSDHLNIRTAYLEVAECELFKTTHMLASLHEASPVQRLKHGVTVNVQNEHRRGDAGRDWNSAQERKQAAIVFQKNDTQEYTPDDVHIENKGILVERSAQGALDLSIFDVSIQPVDEVMDNEGADFQLGFCRKVGVHVEIRGGRRRRRGNGPCERNPNPANVSSQCQH